MTRAARLTTDAPSPEVPGAASVDESVRREIERRAYFRYCARECAHGLDVEDWIAAEREVFAERGATTA